MPKTKRRELNTSNYFFSNEERPKRFSEIEKKHGQFAELESIYEARAGTKEEDEDDKRLLSYVKSMMTPLEAEWDELIKQRAIDHKEKMKKVTW